MSAELPELVLVVLTPRETELARLLLDGFPTDAIAQTLKCSVHTVRRRVRCLCHKAGLRGANRIRLVRALLGKSQPLAYNSPKHSL